MGILAVILGWIAGYRPFGLGPDFPNYQIFFDWISDSWALEASRFEVGFKHLAYFAKHTLNWDLMTFVAAAMAASLFAKFVVFGRLMKPWAAVFCYSLVWFPLHENTQIRAAMAIVFLFLALKPLFDGHWLRYILVSSIAVFFHTSAILAIAVLPAAYLIGGLSRWLWIAAPALVGAVIFAMFEYLLPYFITFRATLLDEAVVSQAVNLFSITNILVLGFLTATFLSGSLDDRRSKTFFVVAVFSFAFFVGFQSIPVLAHRLREILLVYMVFIAFEYRLTMKTLPQFLLALVYSSYVFYSYVQLGLFSD